MLTAQVAVGAVSSVLLLRRPTKVPLQSWLVLVTVWASVLLPLLPAFLKGMGWPFAEDAVYLQGCAVCEALLALAALSSRSLRRAACSLAWVGLLAWVTRWLKASNWEAAALHTAGAWVVWAMGHANAEERTGRGAPSVDVGTQPGGQGTAAPPPEAPLEDFVFFVAATALGALSAHYVFQRGTNTSDEWSYTYQAAVYAKGKLFGEVPACLESFRSFWVYWRDGRMFSQYQPGWPLWMVPFVWIRTIWMAGPASFGLLTMAGVRLGRLATYLYSGRRDLALSGGRFAGVSFLLTNTLVINAGSRFPHILVTALYALAAEQAWLLWHAPGRRDAFRHAALLGFFGGWLVTTRLSEGFLLVGIFLGVVYGLLRRQIALGPFLVAGGVSAVWLVCFVCTAKAQTGQWFVIPFQLTAEFHPWAKLTYSPPPPDLIKWHVPLATGSYCWWPLAPGFGLAGCILGMRSRARSLVVMLGIGSLLMLVYYASITYGRGWDFGYGPRYQLQTVVPMVVGAALVWAHVGMFQDASARRVAWVLASIGVLGVASTTLPYNHQVVSDAMGVALAAQRAGLKNALVVVPPGVGRYGDYDHPKNLPLELYDQDVLLANTKDIQCLRENYSHRKLYQAAGRFPVTFLPMP